MVDLKHGDGYFSTPATSVEQAIELGVDEFPGDTEDDFTAVDCPECGMAGRARPRYRGDIWECEHVWGDPMGAEHQQRISRKDLVASILSGGLGEVLWTGIRTAVSASAVR